jgi:hypothetical protein
VSVKGNLKELTNQLVQQSRNLIQKLKITQVSKKFITCIDPKVHYFVHKSPSTPKPSATFCAGFYSAGLVTCLISMLDNYPFSLDCVLLISVSSSHNLDMPCPDNKDPLNMDFTRYQSKTTHTNS